MKQIHAPINERATYMTKRQEAVRKGVERFFGCLQSRFKISRQERHEWSDSQLILISQACVILQNIAVKMTCSDELCDERDGDGVSIFAEGILHEFERSCNDTTSFEDAETPEIAAAYGTGLMKLLKRNDIVTDLHAHIDLRESLSYNL